MTIPNTLLKKPNRVVLFLGLLLLLQVFGGGLAVFINLFFPFLSEAAFCILAIVLMAEFVILFVVGKCVQVISGNARSLRPRHRPPDTDA